MIRSRQHVVYGKQERNIGSPLSIETREDGFTMVELMITMVIFVIVIAAASQVFTGLLTQFKQQSKISESNTEGIVGLELLRRDLAQAGLGLPWTMNDATYSEAINDTGTFWDDRLLNEDSNPPSAFRLLTNIKASPDNVGVHDSTTNNRVPNSSAAVLTIKAANVATNDTCQKSTYIANNGGLPNTIKVWNSTGDDLVDSDRIIVLNPSDGVSQNILQNNGGGTNFWTTRGDTNCSFKDPTQTSACAFEPPVGLLGKFIVYGIAPSGITPRMPFNRADYYVKIPSSNMPKRCAPNTGVLYKSTVNHSDGKHSELPLLDCVADIQVDFWLDTNPNDLNGTGVDWQQPDAPCGSSPQPSPTSDISCLTAAQIRAQVKEVRVYIVAHEGQKDINYDFSRGGTRTSLNATEISPDATQSRSLATVNLRDLVGDPEYKYYRWKLYTLVVQPNSMR